MTRPLQIADIVSPSWDAKDQHRFFYTWQGPYAFSHGEKCTRGNYIVIDIRTFTLPRYRDTDPVYSVRVMNLTTYEKWWTKADNMILLEGG